MKRPKKIRVTLTKADWDLVTEGVSEWGELTVGESESIGGLHDNEERKARGKAMGDLAIEICVQLSRNSGS